MKIKRDIDNRAGTPIGSSSLAAHLGLSTYRTKYEAYLEWKGETPAPTEEEQKRFDMGHSLEDFIAKEAEKEYGIKLVKSSYAYMDEGYPLLYCHPDRLMRGTVNGERVAVEIKSSSAFDGRWGEENSDEIPMDYMCQVLGYFICKVPCDVVWLIRFSNNRLTRYIIRQNEELMDSLKAGLKATLDDYENGVIPEAADYEEARKINFFTTHDSIEADSFIYKTWQRLSELKAEMKELKTEEDKLKAEIVTFMHDKERLMYQGQKLATYKMQARTVFDSERFRQDHADIYASYLKTSTSMTLRT